MILVRNSSTHILQSGFALLITIVVISVVLAVGISLLNITVKQINLSITGRDSEVAFSAAQAGIECVQVILNQNIDYVSGTPLPGTADCIGGSGTLSRTENDPQANVDRYAYQRSWDADDEGGDDVCTDFDIYIIDATSGDETVTFSNQGIETYTCDNGDVCAAVFSRGYNRVCAELGSLRTVQREITITL
jgi:Tfp pilus assembly protein PilX